MIGLKIFQTEINSDPNILRRAFTLALNMQHVVADLGRQCDLITATLQRITDINLRQTIAITFRRIKKGNPGIKRTIDNLGRGILINTPTKGITAEPDNGDIKAALAADPACFNDCFPVCTLTLCYHAECDWKPCGDR